MGPTRKRAQSPLTGCLGGWNISCFAFQVGGRQSKCTRSIHIIQVGTNNRHKSTTEVQDMWAWHIILHDHLAPIEGDDDGLCHALELAKQTHLGRSCRCAMYVWGSVGGRRQAWGVEHEACRNKSNQQVSWAMKQSEKGIVVQGNTWPRSHKDKQPTSCMTTTQI